jgi:hypothetical protein
LAFSTAFNPRFLMMTLLFGLALGTFAYLGYVLLRPERF